MSNRIGLLIVSALGLGVGASAAAASVVDLTTGPGSSGEINGAVFEFALDRPAGTGVFQPFVRIEMNGTEQGYNTSAATLPFDELPGPWTHDLSLGDIPVVSVGGLNYLEFQLDINEVGAGDLQLLSLDEVQIFTSPVGELNSTDLRSLGALRYQMDFGEDSHVLMDYRFGAGSGESDMRMLIPIGFFAGARSDEYVYLYSQFGLNAQSTAGFEEWRVAMPEPASAILLVLGGACGLLRRRRRAA